MVRVTPFLDSQCSSFQYRSAYLDGAIYTRNRNYLVDSPGEVNSENPELAITGEGRGATFLTTAGQQIKLKNKTVPVTNAIPLKQSTEYKKHTNITLRCNWRNIFVLDISFKVIHVHIA